MMNDQLLHKYINYRFQVAEGNWQRREFASHWWRIYEHDSRWSPPFWPALSWSLDPARNPHLARMDPLLLYGEAFPRRVRATSPQQSDLVGFSTALFEESIAAGVLLRDPRRRDGAAYVAMLHLVNDRTSLSNFLNRAQDLLVPAGARQLIVTTGLSPHLGTGVLQDHFHQLPPLYTPYSPPYLPELLVEACRPLGRSQLYVATVEDHIEDHFGKPHVPGPAQLHPLEPARLATDLLPLFQEATPTWADFPPPDALEATFLLRWLDSGPLMGWVAEVDGKAVGFILLQPDLTGVMHRARGGRRLLWRPWLHWRKLRRVKAGRLLFGGVLANFRRQGIGHQLWQQALRTAVEMDWLTLSVGPIPSTAPANSFLDSVGVKAQRSYLLHRYEFR
jgi:GNAT superfamily N-acetyltransferase